MVEPTTIEETVNNIPQYQGEYEDHHNVTYTDDAMSMQVDKQVYQ
ncbi:MAG: hypothetical protein R2744_01775 [Bacteroidales bacterium]